MTYPPINPICGITGDRHPSERRPRGAGRGGLRPGGGSGAAGNSGAAESRLHPQAEPLTCFCLRWPASSGKDVNHIEWGHNPAWSRPGQAPFTEVRPQSNRRLAVTSGRDRNEMPCRRKR